MIEEPSLDPYLEALREDLPSAKDEARLQRRLLAAGVGVGLAFATKSAVAQSAIAKTGLWASLSTRFLSLPLMAQLGIVTATTTVAATGPAWVVLQRYDGRVASQSVPVRASERARAEKSTELPRPASVNPSEVAREVTATSTSNLVGGAAQILTRPGPKALAVTAPESTSLAEETRILDAALAAIRAGELAGAERLIAKHAELFPAARLARERQRVEEKLAEARRRQGK